VAFSESVFRIEVFFYNLFLNSTLSMLVSTNDNWDREHEDSQVGSSLRFHLCGQSLMDICRWFRSLYSTCIENNNFPLFQSSKTEGFALDARFPSRRLGCPPTTLQSVVPFDTCADTCWNSSIHWIVLCDTQKTRRNLYRQILSIPFSF
jgi:hypothetical protein